MDERIKIKKDGLAVQQSKERRKILERGGWSLGEFWIALQSLEGRGMSFRAYGFRPIERKEVLGEELVIASKL